MLILRNHNKKTKMDFKKKIIGFRIIIPFQSILYTKAVISITKFQTLVSILILLKPKKHTGVFSVYIFIIY